MADSIKIEILEDGQIKFTTDLISQINHANADDLLNELEKEFGGVRIRTKLPKHKHHIHNHNHAHLHN